MNNNCKVKNYMNKLSYINIECEFGSETLEAQKCLIAYPFMYKK